VINSKEEVLENIVNNGVHIFGEIINKKDISKLFSKMKNKRNFGPNLFLSENQYLKSSSDLNSNPNNERNFLNFFRDDLRLIEKNELIQENISNILGEDYEVVVKKAVCGVPDCWLPNWVREKIDGVNVANLGAYIKPEYRDITYFRGIDFHQDIIDWPKGKSDNDPSTFMTLYIYMHDVTKSDSPLHVMPKSHKLGATVFPHNLTHKNKNTWEYSFEDRKMDCEDFTLEGGSGYVGLWHNCTLHGTQPVNDESSSMRLSLRYLLSKKKSNTAFKGIDKINKTIIGELNPVVTRVDLDENGRAKIKGNTINKY
jgi:hypothetical protein